MTRDDQAKHFRANGFGKDLSTWKAPDVAPVTRNPEWFEELLAKHSPLEPQPSNGLPVLTPETYRRVSCHCRGCDVCRWFGDIEAQAFAAPWAKRHALEDPSRPRWATAVAALAEYVELLAYGAPTPSVGELVEHLGAQGARVQTSGPPADSRAIRIVDDRVTIETCLVAAYGPDNDWGLGHRVCVDILLDRKVGRLDPVTGRDGRQHRKRVQVPADQLAEAHGVTPTDIGSIVRSGMRRLRIEMAARGLIRPPRASASMLEAIESRKRSLGRTEPLTGARHVSD